MDERINDVRATATPLDRPSVGRSVWRTSGAMEDDAVWSDEAKQLMDATLDHNIERRRALVANGHKLALAAARASGG